MIISRQKQIRIYKKIRRGIFLVINYFFLNPLNLKVFNRIAKYGYNGDKCLQKGFLPLPVHFYSPVPDVDELIKRKVWDKKNDLKGINFNINQQLSLLSLLGKKFGKQCQWPLEPTKNIADYHVDNPSFSFGCASILYSMVRLNHPKRIIEIGSGNSSKIIAQAISENRKSVNAKTHYTIIDPFPGKYIKKGMVKRNKLIMQNVEMCDPKVFDALGPNDILFIDSSHIVKIANDVNYLYLDILPRLKQGVIIHIHDISLPYEYAKVYITDETCRQLWTEQYLLQAFLISNQEYKILLAMHFIMTDYPDKFKDAFPNYDPEIHKLSSGSFWIQKKKK